MNDLNEKINKKRNENKKKFFISIIALIMLLTSLMVFPIQVSATPGVPVSSITNGGIYYIRSVRSGMYLDVSGAGGNGAQVIQWVFTGNPNQAWKAISFGSYYVLTPMHVADSYALNVYGGGTANGTHIKIYNDSPTNPGGSSLWQINNQGSNQFSLRCSENTNKAAVVEGGSYDYGADVILWPYSGTSNEKWYFEEAHIVSMKVTRDAAYNSMYTSNDALNTMNNVGIPFLKKWGIHFDIDLYSDTLVNQSCPFSSNQGCHNTPPECGTTCVNANTTPNHHKNICYNIDYYNANNNWASYYDMLIVLSGAQMCRYKTAVGHSIDISGITVMNASYLIAENNDYYNTPIKNVRIPQHELSHCFGCNEKNDTPCTDGQDCIMNGDFDLDSNFGDDLCIWCDAHLAELNANQH